jgi:hypothetical protein
MDTDQAREIAERDQLWASLRGLRPEIAQLALGKFENSERQHQVIVLLARIVRAELDYRDRAAAPE